ncbi:hypothetical protein TanjilG_24981 [Lupinus angustifolius]|uniref:Uncharacterized protein n=1 Tax=Lupinus angustifolius TaxID=3871 RepID=A0A1J7I8I8_LUPAN|nr:hypothetical protein TanjilG_24981 [Lupinus angustifolius]
MHMDFDTIMSRIRNRKIEFSIELFRDLQIFKEFTQGFSSSVTNANNVSVTLPVNDHPLKHVRPGNSKIVEKAADGGSTSAFEVSHEAKKPLKGNSPLSEESLPIKKCIGRSKKVGRETTGGQRPLTPMKRKRRVRTKSDNAEDLVPTKLQPIGLKGYLCTKISHF